MSFAVVAQMVFANGEAPVGNDIPEAVVAMNGAPVAVVGTNSAPVAVVDSNGAPVLVVGKNFISEEDPSEDEPITGKTPVELSSGDESPGSADNSTGSTVVSGPGSAESVQSPRPAGVTSKAQAAADVLDNTRDAPLAKVVNAVMNAKGKADSSSAFKESGTPPAGNGAMQGLKQPPTDPIVSDSPQSAKLKTPQEKWKEHYDAILKILEAQGVTPQVHVIWNNAFLFKEQAPHAMNVLSKNQLYDLKNKIIVENSNLLFNSKNCIPFHMMAIGSLLNGMSPHLTILEDISQAWKKVRAHSMKLCSHQGTANRILAMVVQNHADLAYCDYVVFLRSSTKKGMCPSRAAAIKLWISAMIGEADVAWKEINNEEQLSQMREAFDMAARRRAKHGFAAKEEETGEFY